MAGVVFWPRRVVKGCDMTPSAYFALRATFITMFADVLAGVASPVVPESTAANRPEIVITMEAPTFEKAKAAIADMKSMEALDVTANVIEQRVLEGRLTAAEATELMHIIAQRSEQLAQGAMPDGE